MSVTCGTLHCSMCVCYCCISVSWQKGPLPLIDSSPVSLTIILSPLLPPFLINHYFVLSFLTRLIPFFYSLGLLVPFLFSQSLSSPACLINVPLSGLYITEAFTYKERGRKREIIIFISLLTFLSFSLTFMYSLVSLCDPFFLSLVLHVRRFANVALISATSDVQKALAAILQFTSYLQNRQKKRHIPQASLYWELPLSP